MARIEYITATDFDRAWLNFELDLPLVPGANETRNPFYISRPGNPIAELTDALLAPFYRPPKFFFSGHRGCGKSTELLHLMSHPEIKKKFWPLNFSIRDEANIADLDFRDLLLSIGGRMFREYRKSGGEIPDSLLAELNSWRGRVEKEIRNVLSGGSSYETGASIDAFFFNTGVKIRTEPAARVEIRQVLQNDIAGLVAVINSIAAAIYQREKRIPLILVDDMDKPDMETARKIFYQNRDVMNQPNCAIVYTVSSALFYSKEFNAIRDQAIFLPNIILHPRLSPEIHNIDGYETMRKFAHTRMSPNLIEKQALEDAITYSGGIFREMARIMRTAIGRARRSKSARIERADIEWTASELRNEYRRTLEKDDIQLLKQAHEQRGMHRNDRLIQLLQQLAVMEYRDTENWYDIHPVLGRLINE